ncbi:hypothetical protein ACQBJO_16645 [Janibacter sp. G349]|uniref:hypothetical protein n=1 Tax=Janibacter sp. G349 TaxID=3405424 RepID=UPI003B80F7E5
MSTTPESSGNRRDYTYMKYNLYRRCCTFGWQYTATPTGNSVRSWLSPQPSEAPS